MRTGEPADVLLAGDRVLHREPGAGARRDDIGATDDRGRGGGRVELDRLHAQQADGRRERRSSRESRSRGSGRRRSLRRRRGGGRRRIGRRRRRRSRAGLRGRDRSCGSVRRRVLDRRGDLTGQDIAERDDRGRRRAACAGCVAGANGRRREEALGIGEPEHGRRVAGTLLGRPVAAVIDPEHRALQRDRDALVREPVESGKQLQAGRRDAGPEQARDRRTNDLSHRRPETPKPPCMGPLLRRRGICRCRHFRSCRKETSPSESPETGETPSPIRVRGIPRTRHSIEGSATRIGR